MYYGWSKEFLEAGKRRLAGDTAAPRPLTRGLELLGKDRREQSWVPGAHNPSTI